MLMLKTTNNVRDGVSQRKHVILAELLGAGLAKWQSGTVIESCQKHH